MNMPELIDKNALQEALREEYDMHKAFYDQFGHIERGGIVQGLSYAQMILCNSPTIEAEPVRHGWWIPYTKNRDENVTNVFQCSECEKTVRFIMAHKMCEYTFCPFCGAKMR